MSAVALSIAGSDPGGGAGIQADLRVFEALQVTGVSAISALTVQNSLGVSSVHAVDPSILRLQIEGLVLDHTLNVVKIGMLRGAKQARAVVDALGRDSAVPVVLDPVIRSSSGAKLNTKRGIHAMVTTLFPRCYLITPNVAEAAVLTGIAIECSGDLTVAIQKLLNLRPANVLVTGWKDGGNIVDMLCGSATGGTVLPFSRTRIDTNHSHGTGCFLSAAIAARLALGDSLLTAVDTGTRLIGLALHNPIADGAGRGYPGTRNAAAALPECLSHFERLQKLRGLYVVTDESVRYGRSHYQIAVQSLLGGANVIQLRDKCRPAAHLLPIAERIGELVHDSKRLFIVNDRVDLALASQADGVHLGPEDMPPQKAREIMGPHMLIGVSISSVAEARKHAEAASYFGVGAIFGSKTKDDAGKPIGLNVIKAIRAAFPNHPIVAIGGIDSSNISEVADAGADAAAVISAVVAARSIKQATVALRERFYGATLRGSRP